MNVEQYRDYCLSLGADVEEKLPFVKLYELTKEKYGK